jgi:hypothetical protein
MVADACRLVFPCASEAAVPTPLVKESAKVSQIFGPLHFRPDREAGAWEIAVPDRSGDLPAAVRLPPPDPDALTFIMDGRCRRVS